MKPATYSRLTAFAGSQSAIRAMSHTDIRQHAIDLHDALRWERIWSETAKVAGVVAIISLAIACWCVASTAGCAAG